VENDMALNQTTTTIVGRLASEPSHKLTMNDVDVTHFRLASNERRYDRQADRWVNGDQLFIDVTCWRRLAFNVKACLVKGDPVVVYGRLYTSEYEVDGKRRFQTRMEALSVGPDLSWITTALRRRQQKPDAEGTESTTSELTPEPEPALTSGGAPGLVEQPVGESPESIDELARQLLAQPPDGAGDRDGRPAQREEALMAGV
jgi:single-strand DNA-binding protein